MREKAKNVLRLFLTFLKIGAFTFGGGYAMIPIIQRETVEKNKWISEDDILEIIAVAESTPGPIAINSATFIGFRVAGFWGSFAATFGVVLPSFLIILLVSFLLNEFGSLTPVRYAFFGIRAAVLALLLKALWSMYKQCPKNVFSYIVMGASFVLAAIVKVPVIFIIIGCAVFGLVTSAVMKRREKKK